MTAPYPPHIDPANWRWDGSNLYSRLHGSRWRLTKRAPAHPEVLRMILGLYDAQAALTRVIGL